MNATHRRRHSTQRRRYVLIGCICTTTAIGLMVVIGFINQPWFSHGLSDAQIGSREAESARTASIMIESDGKKCEVMMFNNDTGRTGEGSGRCKSSVPVDAHGIPVPTGTIHRLDAISKSFYGAGR